MVYIFCGNKIIFCGVDDLVKIKGIKVLKFLIVFFWIEEMVEFKIEDEILIIEKLVFCVKLDEGFFYVFYYFYNLLK